MNMRLWNLYLERTLQHGKLEDHPPNYDILDLFYKSLPANSFKKVLEIGAGAGVDMNVLMSKGYDVTGIDMLDVNIEYAKEHLGLQIQKMDMHNLEFSGATFDGILTIQTFEHALSPFITVSEICRVLHPKGRVFLDTPDANDESMWQIWHPNLLYPEQIIRLFNNLGLEVIENLSHKHRTQIVFEKM